MTKKTKKRRTTKADLEELIQELIVGHENDDVCIEEWVDNAKSMLGMSNKYKNVVLCVNSGPIETSAYMDVEDPSSYRVRIQLANGDVVDGEVTEVIEYC